MTRSVFFAGFFLTLSAALTYYVNSSFLGELTGGLGVDLVYALAALIAIIFILLVPILGRRYGLLHPSRWFTLAFFASLVTLAISQTPAAQITAFVLFYASVVNLGLWLDLYLETQSSDQHTGRIRGGYLTIINFAVLLAPYATGQTLDYTGNYRSIYLLAGFLTIPLLYQMFFKLSKQSLPAPGLAWREKLRDRNLQKVLLLDFLLNVFFFFMVIYLPLHLRETIGFSWGEIGTIFTIMLLPFVLIEYLLGWLADRRFGEKEILSLGLIVTALATIPIAFLSTTSFIVWASLLFLTRVGASAVESMKETYLFKKVTAGDIGVISLSRLTVPFAYIIGSLVSIVFIHSFSISALFLLIGVLFLGGLYFSLTLEDTR